MNWSSQFMQERAQVIGVRGTIRVEGLRNGETGGWSLMGRGAVIEEGLAEDWLPSFMLKYCE